MRRVGVAALLGAVLVSAPGCVPEEPKPAEPAPAPAAPRLPAPVADPRLTDEEFKEVVRYVLMPKCGLGVDWAAYDTVARAGADVLPVLAELVAEDTNPILMLGAMNRAGKYPLHEGLRSALRTRRDNGAFRSNEYEMMTKYAFRYFTKFGDETDLGWMERAVGELPEEDRPRGEEHVRELRGRLVTN